MFNPINSDPPIDRDFPATMKSLIIDSHGEKLNALIYLASGSGPHPTAILLHGFPGYERNLDMAQAVRRAGWNALYFNYRGSWGSEGAYSQRHSVEDTLVALQFLRGNASDYRVDPERIALIGHSMGGACALAAAMQDTAVQHVASLAGANWGGLVRLAQNDSVAFEKFAVMLENNSAPITEFSGHKFLNELIANHEQYDVQRNAKRLTTKTILLVGGLRDEITPLDTHYYPMLQALEAENALRLTHQLFDDDHFFSSHRIALTQLLISWLSDKQIK